MPQESGPFRAFDVTRVRAALATTPFADVRYVAETGSTNDDAGALLGDAHARGTTIIAEYQSAGRGRKTGRRWIAARAQSLLFTTIVPHTVATDALWAVPFWTALAAADGIAAACGARVDLRWPNDGYLADNKVFGILCLSRVHAERAAVACGIGINVMRAESSSAIEPPAAFISDVAAAVEREAVFIAIMRGLERSLSLLERPADIARRYEARAELAGAHYALRIDATNERLNGVALGLSADGSLRITVDGEERSVNLADVGRA